MYFSFDEDLKAAEEKVSVWKFEKNCGIILMLEETNKSGFERIKLCRT